MTSAAEVPLEAEAEAIALREPLPEPIAQCARARGSLPFALTLPQRLVTQRDYKGRAVRAARALSNGEMLTGSPASLAEARAQIHVAAGRWNAPAVRWPRIAYGYLWLLVKAIANGLEKATEYPAGLVILAALAAICWRFL